LLGTTFGGTHLGCAAGLAVLNVLESEKLMDNATHIGGFLINELKKFEGVEVRGRGLMIGIEFNYSIKELRKLLLEDYKIFTGVASNPNVIRVLPPLCLTKEQAQFFIESLQEVITKIKKDETVSIN